MEAPEHKIRFWLYDLLLAGFAAYFLIFPIRNLLVGWAFPVVGIWGSIGIGALLSFKFQIRGMYAFFAAVMFGLLCLPLVFVGLLYAGTQAWIFPVAAVGVFLLAFFSVGLVRALGLALCLALALPIFLTPTMIGDKYQPKCPHMPEPVIAAGGIIPASQGVKQLSCGMDSQSFIASLPGQGKVSLMSVAGGEIDSVEFPAGQPEVLGAGASLLFAYDRKEQKGTVLDMKSLTHYQSVDLEGFSCDPCSAAISARNVRTFLLCRNTGNVLFVDTLRGAPLNDTEPLVGVPFALRLNPLFNKAYVTDLAGDTMREIEIETTKLLRKINIGFSQTDVAVSGGGKTIYVARPFSSKINVFETETLKSLKKLNAPYGVTRLALDEKGDRIFAAAYATGRLYVIDLTDQRTQQFDFGTQIRDMIYCKESERLLIAAPCGIYYLEPEKLLNHF